MGENFEPQRIEGLHTMEDFLLNSRESVYHLIVWDVSA